ncbi:GntR family transcriptional regulator [Microbacterium sp. G2-8]|uniref:GntR family transcriptional regulator n=1 Tax=Microbacterium sp. G2-8 TaxID=2842454 RepID=UPI001C897E93|nr:GntR family transcriptional regulator [Microbacterium sp. G2-8]
MLQPVASTTVRLADAVFSRISDAIITGTLAPGERLRDAELARSMGVSRMPVREALQRLERVGLVEMSPSRYTRVTTVTPELSEDSLQYAGYYAASTLHMATQRMDDDQRRAFNEAIDDITSRLEADGRAVEERRALHRLLAEIAGNAFMETISRDAVLAISRNLQGIELPLSDPAVLVENYRQLREAVVAGDAPRAERLMREQFGI